MQNKSSTYWNLTSLQTLRGLFLSASAFIAPVYAVFRLAVAVQDSDMVSRGRAVQFPAVFVRSLRPFPLTEGGNGSFSHASNLLPITRRESGTGGDRAAVAQRILRASDTKCIFGTSECSKEHADQRAT